MNKTTRQHLLAEMELAKSLMKLSREERRKELRRQMYVELKAMEMERRQRVAQEAMEKSKRGLEEMGKVTESRRRQREEKEKMGQEVLEKKKPKQLKKKTAHWNEMMMVEKLKRPKYTLSALKEHERRQEEVEFCCLPEVVDKADPESRASYLKSAGGKKKTLYNNWVGEEIKTDSDPVKENMGTSVYLYFAEKYHKSEEKNQTPKHKQVHWMDDGPITGQDAVSVT